VTHKWLVDLVSIPPERQHQIPVELRQKNYESGRIVLEEGDPQLSRLTLLGARSYRLNSLDWKPPGVDRDE
jgi:hypothetical protein